MIGRRGLAVFREAKVVAHHHDPGRQLPRQQLGKTFSREVTQSLAEAQHPQPVRPPLLGENPPALAQAGQPGGRSLASQVLAGHRLEGQQHRRRSQAVRMLLQPPEQRLMSEVNAIVRTDGDGTP
jgi:hypothetical protein